MKDDNLRFLVGSGLPDAAQLTPYNDTVCSFLSALSEILMRERGYPDVVSFAFFCRKANISRLRQEFGTGENRLGRGIVFHVTPSNIPINFAFSLIFGMLSGNSNIVRVPTKNWPQVDIVCGAINELLKRNDFRSLANSITMLRYERSDEITGYFSEHCDARILWGGDDTVKSIRKIPIPPRSVEMTFADRYSLCVLGGDAISNADEIVMARLADNFYNDTYLVDQNACSSPNLIVWLKAVRETREKFWNAVFSVAHKYDLQPVHVMDKYTALAEYLCHGDIENVVRHENLIYRVNLKSLKNIERLRGRFGMFFEFDAAGIDELAQCVTERWQTMTYYGVEKNVLRDFVADNSLRGIDRFVPVGSALDIGVIWDGYDIVRTLSRVIEVK